MSEYLKTSELTESGSFIQSFVKEIVVEPGKAVVRYTILRTVVVPGIAPFVVSGLRGGINYAMVGILTAEFFASSQGIGRRMMLYISNFEVEYFFGCTALAGCGRKGSGLKLGCRGGLDERYLACRGGVEGV